MLLRHAMTRIGRGSRAFAAAPKPQNSTINRAPIGWGALGVLGAAGAGCAYYYEVEKTRRQEQAGKAQKTYGTPSLGGPWTLVDATSGEVVTDASFHGRYVLLYFGFSRCPDICPSELLKVQQVLRLLGEEAPTPLFVSLDPKRDSLRQLRVYAKDFDARIHFLVGTPLQCKAAAKAYRVYSSIGQVDDADDEDYLIDHSIVLYLVGPDGKFLDFFTQATPAEKIAEKVRAHRAA
jgi:protein SCO1/2